MVTLAHGGGGSAMRNLIDDVFVSVFDNPALAPLEDQARFPLAELSRFGDRLAFTTDSYVVDPLFFPGGDIGKLAICGTINDLAVGGATPLYLTCSAIIEEGLEVDTLRALAKSMALAAADAGRRYKGCAQGYLRQTLPQYGRDRDDPGRYQPWRRPLQARRCSPRQWPARRSWRCDPQRAWRHGALDRDRE
jgi:hypothetical protein